MTTAFTKKRLLVALIIIAVVASFALGMTVGKDIGKQTATVTQQETVKQPEQLPVVNKEEGKPRTVDFGLFWQVWDTLHDQFVDNDQLDTQTLIQGAIDGMVKAAGDPYTVFLPPKDTKVFRENVSGEFSGVGMEIGIRDEQLTVIAPLKNTPAERSGIRSGDTIVQVDGQPTKDMSIDEAVQVIRGPKGTQVRLMVLRPSNGEEAKEIVVTRDVIQIPVLEWEFAEDSNGNRTTIAHVRLFHFAGTAPRLFQQAVNQLLVQGATGVVLDLRGNPGGFLEVAVDIASWFLEPNQVVAVEWFGPNQQREYRSANHPLLSTTPVVVLVDEGSASASEIVAGALRDTRGIQLVGIKTFGKGSVQTLEDFADGSSLKVTVAKWLTPSGTSINDDGLKPDVLVERLEPEEGQAPEDIPDVQLQRALELF